MRKLIQPYGRKFTENVSRNDFLVRLNYEHQNLYNKEGKMRNIFLTVLVSLAVSVTIIGQTKLTENTLKLKKEAKGASALPSSMSWIEGTWTGDAFGGNVKEVWTKPGGGAMIGMFSLVKDGKPVFYEFMTFTVENGELFLKLKHFHPNLVSWEEKEKTTNFRFIKTEGKRYYFSGLTFENVSDTKLNIYLALTQDGKTHEEVFNFTKAE